MLPNFSVGRSRYSSIASSTVMPKGSEASVYSSETMSTTDLKKQQRLEKNREIARNCRKRKREKFEMMESEVWNDSELDSLCRPNDWERRIQNWSSCSWEVEILSDERQIDWNSLNTWKRIRIHSQRKMYSAPSSLAFVSWASIWSSTTTVGRIMERAEDVRLPSIWNNWRVCCCQVKYAIQSLPQKSLSWPSWSSGLSVQIFRRSIFLRPHPPRLMVCPSHKDRLFRERPKQLLLLEPQPMKWNQSRWLLTPFWRIPTLKVFLSVACLLVRRFSSVRYHECIRVLWYPVSRWILEPHL